MKKISVIFLIIGILVASAYAYIRFSLKTPGFTPAEAKDTTQVTKQPENFLDLKPKLVEKLQQLVKQGSNGLYNLFIHELKPDILNSRVSISGASLIPDTAGMQSLAKSKNLPGEIFKIKADSIWIDGIGLKDILSKNDIDVKTIHILQPVIDVYNQEHPNDKDTSSKTLYQRLMNQMKHIGIDKIIIEKGTLITHHAEKKQETKFNDIAIVLSNIIIDSTTQFDRNRFLFAKEAELSMKDYAVPSSNNLYTFKVGSFSISATKKLLVAKNIALEPHYSKDEFQKHIQTQLECYSINIPSIEFRNTNWWDLLNNQVLKSDYAKINSANISVYLDRRKPADGGLRQSFPHQLLMKIHMKLNIKKLDVDNLNLVYEEFSTLSGKKGKMEINRLKGSITNLTNLPEAIKRNHITTINASGVFMNLAPAFLTLNLDLAKYKSGVFSAELKSAGGFDGTAVNPVSEPLGLFMVKKGNLKKLTSYVTGNNYKASGNVLMLYDDLHITPMKKDPQSPGELKKKSVTSLIANSFVLKDENPSKDGEVRKSTASYTRKSGTFFNMIWKTTFVGILKTIGAPEKLAYE